METLKRKIFDDKVYTTLKQKLASNPFYNRFKNYQQKKLESHCGTNPINVYLIVDL